MPLDFVRPSEKKYFMRNYIMILLKISLGKKDDKQRSLDECVKDKHKECTDALQVIYS